MDSNIDNAKDKKLGFYLSFKKSEKELYEQIKSINNYSNVIKTVMGEYLTNKNKDEIKNLKKGNTITLTIDDLCRIISSVNLSNSNSALTTNNVESKDISNSNLHSAVIPEDMLIGL